MQSESSVQKAILRLLNARTDTWAVKTITTNRNGTPDILACIGGLFVAIEVKAARGVVAPLQQYQIDLINSTGGTAIVARNINEVKDMLSALERMEIQDGNFDAVDPVIRDELLAMRDRLRDVEDLLHSMLYSGEVTELDIKEAIAATQDKRHAKK